MKRMDSTILMYVIVLKYRKWSNKPPGAYLSKWVLGEGAYSRGGLFERGVQREGGGLFERGVKREGGL